MSSIEYLEFSDQIPFKITDQITALHVSIFKKPFENFEQSLFPKKRYLCLVALCGDKVVGYKIGYQRKLGHYFSWIGAVQPEFRRRGIASHLMKLQHHWCTEHGFKSIRTITKQHWLEMLLLNLKNGYKIIRLFRSREDYPKIVLEKELL
jgi:GNAT superfamily N-acetyltransferase